MTAREKIETLVEARINGNSIDKDKFYTNMIKSLRTTDFNKYDNEFYGEPITMWVYKKIDKIEVYVEKAKKGKI
jgi:hypothetical protein